MTDHRPTIEQALTWVRQLRQGDAAEGTADNWRLAAIEEVLAAMMAPERAGQHYQFHSRTSGAVYTTVLNGRTGISCDCPGFRFRQRCRHSALVLAGHAGDKRVDVVR